MAKIIIMPRQGQSVEECIITKWSKKVGEKVAAGDILFSYETDKSAFDETSDTNGVLLAALYDEGDIVPCLSPVCIIGEAGEDISSLLAGIKTPKNLHQMINHGYKNRRTCVCSRCRK